VDVGETGDAWIFEVELPDARRSACRSGSARMNWPSAGKSGNGSGRCPALPHPGHRQLGYRTTLLAGADADRAEARFDNGLLTVRVPGPKAPGAAVSRSADRRRPARPFRPAGQAGYRVGDANWPAGAAGPADRGRLRSAPWSHAVTSDRLTGR